MEAPVSFALYRLDLTGLRAAQVVNYRGVLYDVDRVEVSESFGGRRHGGSPWGIQTTLDLKLNRARWVDEPGIEPPADPLVLPDMSGARKTVINGQAWWIESLSEEAAYIWGVGVPPEPEHIGLRLIRNPTEDEETTR